MIAPLWIIGFFLFMWCLRQTRPHRQMPFLAAYLAFGAVRTLLLIVTAITGPATRYWAFYWPLQGIGYTLSAVLALSLILRVTRDPRRRIDLYALIGMVFLLPFCSCLGAGEWHPWLSVAKWCDMAVMWLLLYSLVWFRDRWEPVDEALAFGLIIGMAGHVACALLQSDHDPAPWLRALYQLSGIAQLTVWAVTLGTGRRHRSPIVPLQHAGAGSG